MNEPQKPEASVPAAARRRRVSWTAVLRLLVASAGLAYIISVIQWRDQMVDGALAPGFLSTLRNADPLMLAAGLAAVAAIFPMQAYRWWLLMSARNLGVSLGQSFKLMMVGTFFNFAMPGTTGGDLIRAAYAARREEGRGSAMASILLDRITGLLALVLLAGLVGLTMINDRQVAPLILGCWLGLAAIILAGAVYGSRRIRRILRPGRWVERLPDKLKNIIQKVDEALVGYRAHYPTLLAALLVSLPVHILLSLGAALAGWAVGIEAPLTLMMIIIPLTLLLGAVPISYQGLGLMEAVAIPMLLTHQNATATGNQVVMMLMLLRIYQMACGLLGAFFLIRGRLDLRDLRQEAEQLASRSA